MTFSKSPLMTLVILGLLIFLSVPLSLQGTPLKSESLLSLSAKKHDVRSIIGSPGRTFHPMHPLDVMQDTRTLERAYEESLKSRPSPVANSGGSITRGAPVIVPEPGKPRHSPLAYEDHQVAHGTAFSSHLHRGSPVTTREPTPRQHEGEWCSSSAHRGHQHTVSPPSPPPIRERNHICRTRGVTLGSKNRKFSWLVFL